MDTRDAEKIFPIEVWTIILDSLEDFKDIQHGYLTCHLWKSALAKKVTIIWKFTQVFPNLFHYLSKQDILNARTVCKPWSRAVEKYLEEEQPAVQKVGGRSLYPIGYDTVRSLEVDIIRRHFDEPIDSVTHKLNNFLRKYPIKLEKNIFLSRSLYLIVRYNEPLPLVLKIFQLHGHHIWTLSLRALLFVNLPIVELAKFVWQLLSFVPNLRKLQLVANCKEPHFWKEEEKQALQLFLQENPTPPPLVHLKNLELNVNLKPITDIMFAEYAQQLTSYYETWNPHYPYCTTFKKLKRLTWMFIYNERNISTLYYLDCPLLTQLCINLIKNVGNQNTCRTASFTRKVFSAIEKYSETLQHLTIYWKYFIEPIPTNIYLPHLSEICLEFFTGSPTVLSLSILVNLRGLKKVTLMFHKMFYQQIIAEKQGNKETIWRCTCSEEQISRNGGKCLAEEMHKEEMKGERIDLKYFLDEFDENTVAISDGFKRPYESNIWRLIPSLNIIVVKVYWNMTLDMNIRSKIYYRKEYNAFILNGQIEL